MSTNMFIQKGFNKLGGAKFEIFDTLLAAYSEPTAILNFGFTPETENVMQEAHIQNVRLETDRRLVKTGGMMRFTMREQMTPEVAHYAFGDPAIAQVLTAQTVVGDVVTRTLYNTDVQFMTNEYGLINNVDLALPTYTPTVNAAAAGSGWVVGDAFVFLLACWGSAANTSAAGAAGWTDIVDDEFTVGAISASQTLTIANITDDIEIAIDDYSPGGTVDGPTPDFWALFVSDDTNGDTIVGSELVTSTVNHAGFGICVPGTTLDYDVLVATSTTTYVAAIGILVQTIDAGTYAAGAPTYTKLVADTDYTYNSVVGTLKRIAGGGISHGEKVRVTYWAFEPYRVATAGGSVASDKNIKKCRVTAFESEVDPVTGDPQSAEGERWIFFRVNMKGTQPDYNYDENAFTDGANIELTTLYDQSENKIFEHQSWSMKHRNWVQVYD